MRRLAQSIGVQAPSLYWHFASRGALLEGMADAMLDNVARPTPNKEDWDEVVRRVGRETRAALRARRDGAKLFAGTYPVSENVFRAADAIMTAIKNAEGKPQVDLAALRAPIEAYAKESGHPTIVEALPAILDENFDARFEFGLDLIVRGLASHLSAFAAR
jgi:AcrR family transcriptional regulator